MAISTTRRNFVRSAPLAAAALLPSAATVLHAAVQEQAPPIASNFELVAKGKMDELLAGVQGSLSTKDVVPGKGGMALSAVISAEEKKIAKEFEYHEHRDHLFQVLDGTTVVEVGGTPKNARQTKPGEWLAPESEGATRLTLNKGDYLSIPRMVPHKRMTEGKVSLLLIHATTPA